MPSTRRFLAAALIAAATAATALETPIPVAGLLGPYQEGEIRTVTLMADLPADAVVTGLFLSLEGTSVPGLYYDQMAPDPVVQEYWGQFTPYFQDTDPYVYGWVDAFAESWNGAVEWRALFGNLHWEFLADGVQEMSFQFLGPAWVGSPVIVRSLAVEVTGALAILSYESEVAEESATWSDVKRLWR